MRAFVLTIGLSVGLLLFAGRANAQWKYADDKGVIKVRSTSWTCLSGTGTRPSGSGLSASANQP